MPGKVLIADDSLKVQKELTQLLKAAGIEAVTVSNGEHAVRKLSSVQPDLVLADIFMPVRTGYEVCDYIKKSEEFAGIPVLLLASKLEPYDEKEAQRVRADGRLEKPFADPAAALATIKQCLSQAAPKPAPAPAPAPAAPIPEFAAAVPAAPEPEPEMFATRPAPVTFESHGAPMGFTDMEEHPAPAAPPAREPPVDLSQATLLSTAADLQRRVQKDTAPLPAEAPPPVAGFEPPPPPPPVEKTGVAKPELAAAWEMTGPEPGAPEIPAAGGWDSQWKGGTEDTVALEPPPAAPERERPFAPDEFAAAFGAETKAAAAAPPPPAAPSAAPAEELAAVDPAVVDEVVKRVLERLSPQLTETIAREIVRPLTEALLKAKR